MSAETFFARWSRRKAETAPAAPPDVVADASLAIPAAEPGEVAVKPPPTLEDVAALTADSDFKPFVARGVDEAVRRSAMKKLFTDPHFNIMDGLDIYIDDYSKFEPIPPEMLAQLNHAKDLLNPLAMLDRITPKPLAQAPAVELAEAAPAAREQPAAAPELGVEPSPASAPEPGLAPEATPITPSVALAAAKPVPEPHEHPIQSL